LSLYRPWLHDVWHQRTGVNLLQCLDGIYNLLLVCIIYQLSSMVGTYVKLLTLTYSFRFYFCAVSIDKLSHEHSVVFLQLVIY